MIDIVCLSRTECHSLSSHRIDDIMVDVGVMGWVVDVGEEVEISEVVEVWEVPEMGQAAELDELA